MYQLWLELGGGLNLWNFGYAPPHHEYIQPEITE